VPLTRGPPRDGGYRITGRKAFASMIAAADYVMVMAYPDEATAPTAGMLLPRASGRSRSPRRQGVGHPRDAGDAERLDAPRGLLGAEDALLIRTDDIVPFRRDGANWFWGSYTPVYLGIGVRRVPRDHHTVRQRTPPGFSQPLAYHPDVRRHVRR
jgi:alkylation response protein AidB-like acyl-CoA dehydrogenase